MREATYHTISGANLLDNYKVHYYFDTYAGGASNAHVYSDGDPQYSGKIFSHEGASHTSAALDLFTGDLGTGTFSGGANDFYDYVTIENSSDLFSGEFSLLIGAQTTSRQDVGIEQGNPQEANQKGPLTNNNILFSNMGGAGFNYSGWQLGINAANRAYLECIHNFQPLITTYMGQQNPYQQNIWGLVCREGFLKLGLYDITTENFYFESMVTNVSNLQSTRPWIIGSGINYDPNAVFSPFVTANSGFFAGKINNFLYFNTGLTDELMGTVAQSLYSELAQITAPIYDTGGTGFVFGLHSGSGISGEVGMETLCSVTGYLTATVGFKEKTELTGTLNVGDTYYREVDQRDHPISGVIKNYRALYYTGCSTPTLVVPDTNWWTWAPDGDYTGVYTNTPLPCPDLCWHPDQGLGETVTITWAAGAGTPWTEGIAAEALSSSDMPGGCTSFFKWPDSLGAVPTPYDITISNRFITGFTITNHATGYLTPLTGCSGSGITGAFITGTGFPGSGISGFNVLLVSGVSGLSGVAPGILKPNAFSYIGAPLQYEGVVEKYNLGSFGIGDNGTFNNLATVAENTLADGHSFYLKKLANSGSLGLYLNGVGRELGGISFRSTQTSRVFFDTALNKTFAQLPDGQILDKDEATLQQISEFFNNYNIISGDYYIMGAQILETLPLPFSNPNILDIYDTGLNTGTVRSMWEVTELSDYISPPSPNPISVDQWVFFNGQKLVSGINYIDDGGFSPSGYITGITGTYFTIPPPSGTVEVTGSDLSFEGTPFFPNSNVIFINGVREDVSTSYVEHSNTKDLISGKKTLRNYGTNLYNNYG